MWNEFLPISMPMTATAVWAVWDMACSLPLAPLASCLWRPWPAFTAGGAGARPDHPISKHRQGFSHAVAKRVSAPINLLVWADTIPSPETWGAGMRRRKFIALLGGIAGWRGGRVAVGGAGGRLCHPASQET